VDRLPYGEGMTMRPVDLARIGKVLYGDFWVAPLAIALGRHRETISKAAKGDRRYRGILESSKPKLIKLLEKKLEQVKKELDHTA
jgi:hypothetical protein